MLVSAYALRSMGRQSSGTHGSQGAVITLPNHLERAMSEAIVHIVDDDEDLRETLGSLLRSVGMTVRLYANAQEFIASATLESGGCLVVDVRLPGISGLDLQEHLVRIGVGMPIIVMTGSGDIPMTVRAMKAGAVDFLPKPFRDQDMIDAVLAALEVARESQSKRSEENALRQRFASLTAREREVFELVAQGLMNKQIAFQLALSEVTVKAHRGQMMRKMEARTLAELVRMADLMKIGQG